MGKKKNFLIAVVLSAEAIAMQGPQPGDADLAEQLFQSVEQIWEERAAIDLLSAADHPSDAVCTQEEGEEAASGSASDEWSIQGDNGRYFAVEERAPLILTLRKAGSPTRYISKKGRSKEQQQRRPHRYCQCCGVYFSYFLSLPRHPHRGALPQCTGKSCNDVVEQVAYKRPKHNQRK